MTLSSHVLCISQRSHSNVVVSEIQKHTKGFLKSLFDQTKQDRTRDVVSEAIILVYMFVRLSVSMFVCPLKVPVSTESERTICELKLLVLRVTSFLNPFSSPLFLTHITLFKST